MDLAAAAAGDRVTQMSLSRAGRSSWRTWVELRGLNDYAFTGSGPTRQSDARDSELLVLVDVARAGHCFDYPLLLFNLRPAVYQLGAARFWMQLILSSVTIF